MHYYLLHYKIDRGSPAPGVAILSATVGQCFQIMLHILRRVDLIVEQLSLCRADNPQQVNLTSCMGLSKY